MNELETPSFTQFFKRNLKLILTYWSQTTLTLSFLSAGLGILTLYVYTNTIGRPDLFLVAIDAKAALAIWLLIILLIMMAYLVILGTTTWFYGITISIFDKVPNNHASISRWLLAPLTIGFSCFIVSSFFFSEVFSAEKLISAIYLITIIAYLTIFFSPNFRKIFLENTVHFKLWQKIIFFIASSTMLWFTVILASIPTSLILTSYIGEDTPEALRHIALVALITLLLSLAPTFIYFNSKGHIYKRIFYSFSAGLIAFFIFLIMAPGAMSSITYASARKLDIRQTELIRFTLDSETALGDLDNRQWQTRLHSSKKVEISAFPLFIFGDLLLLCPSDLLGHKLHKLHSYTSYCIATRNSKVSRKPTRPRQSSLQPAPLTWQEYATLWLNWEKLKASF
nr:hypothetical protein [Pseudomonas luteola]